MIRHWLRVRSVVAVLGLLFGVSTFLLPSAAHSICEVFPTYWACVGTETQCGMDEECFEYYCSNDEWTGQSTHFHINLNC